MLTEKAPVDGIQIDNLGETKLQKKKFQKIVFLITQLKLQTFIMKTQLKTCLIG